MKLTHRTIDEAEYGGALFAGKPSRFVLWDEAISGLGLRIFPSEKKSFVLSYRSDGRKRLMSLGRYGVLTLDQARRKARKFLAQADEGIDPLEEKRKRNRELRRAHTVADLCDAFLERHARRIKKTWREDQRRIEKHIKPRLGSLRLKKLTREHVDQLYREVGSQAPYEANRVIALLSAMIRLAPEWGFLPEGHPNPARIRR